MPPHFRLMRDDDAEGMKAAIPDLDTVTVNTFQICPALLYEAGLRGETPPYFHRGMKITPMELLLLR